MKRRDFLGGLVLAVANGSIPVDAAKKSAIRAIAFDAFVIFDVRGVLDSARRVLGDSGTGFAKSWLQKLFADTWLHTSANRYQPFEVIAAASLAATVESAQIDLPDRAKSELIQAFSMLDVWPDVRPALERLHSAGVRTAILSNFSHDLLNSNLRRAGLMDAFDIVLSTDQVRHFKPSPIAYAMGPQALRLPIREVGFAAFGGWDAVGATWFGFRTAWVNRVGAAREWLDVAPEITSPGMDGVLALAGLA